MLASPGSAGRTRRCRSGHGQSCRCSLSILFACPVFGAKVVRVQSLYSLLYLQPASRVRHKVNPQCAPEGRRLTLTHGQISGDGQMILIRLYYHSFPPYRPAPALSHVWLVEPKVLGPRNGSLGRWRKILARLAPRINLRIDALQNLQQQYVRCKCSMLRWRATQLSNGEASSEQRFLNGMW